MSVAPEMDRIASDRGGESPFAEAMAEGDQAIRSANASDAETAYRRALGVDPDSVRARLGLATACYLQKKWPESRRQYEEVAQRDPLNASAVTNLGALCNCEGDYESAISHLRRAIQLDPRRSEGYYNLGLAYRRIEKLDLAADAYQRAFLLNQRLVEAAFNLANIHFESGRYGQAAGLYRQVLSSTPGCERATEGLRRSRRAMSGSPKLAESPELS